MPRRAPLRVLVPLLLLLCAAPALALQAGDAAPAFSAPALRGGGSVSLAAFRGKVVYLDFWASWCAPCLTALPAIEALRKEFPHGEFQVVAVNVDRDPAVARAFLARRPVGYPSASDPKGDIPRRFEIGTMPTSFLIDRKGVIRHVHQGFRPGDVDDLRARIRELLSSR
jgi:thiol-disulfide isomerase/thioredoxin